MTKKHFIAAANLVSSILKGEWTNDSPYWANPSWADYEVDTPNAGNLSANYVRATQTAEAFIILFRSFNPQFDDKRFLKACGFDAE